ncbi:DNA alkylation repair protein [Paenibacillus sp. PAMC21692]|uniref:DNA alkylation repair protein n=1 Tax=Paenibacillus sp. PAMC21692 TaxID=2762320 RepID=UPI00164D1723|nr:DNA alkylation repair protein [Paenibacillus sp. PAMC21692]QNK56468.1 DNA alkylation repair protein [Paenibacillus sp. PAMC21692]
MNTDKVFSIPSEVKNRTGPVRASEIQPEVLHLLNSGCIETVNLTEWLAVDHFQLLERILLELGLDQHTQSLLSELERVNGQSTMKVIPAIANKWLTTIGLQTDGDSLHFEKLAIHRSDSVRCWAAFIVGLSQFDLDHKLNQMRRFAADSHFGVREIAWMAVRQSVSEQLNHAIHRLSEWVQAEDANVRRFAVEVTRPRGVWSRHITELKEYPEKGLPLLEPLKSDPSKYVQDSVANWLNDAAKSRPDWVADVCRSWLETSNHKATMRITSRAQRNIAGNG